MVCHDWAADTDEQRAYLRGLAATPFIAQLDHFTFGSLEWSSCDRRHIGSLIKDPTYDDDLSRQELQNCRQYLIGARKHRLTPLLYVSEIHEHSCQTLPTILSVDRIVKVVEMSIILLAYLVMQDLEPFSISHGNLGTGNTKGQQASAASMGLQRLRKR